MRNVESKYVSMKKVRFNEKGHCAYNNGENNSDQKIYAYMARISGNDECRSEKFGDSSQLTNWILDSRATCHMTPKVSLGHSLLPDICAIDAYIFWSLLFSPLSHARLTFSLKRTCFRRFSLYFGGFGNFTIM